MGIVKIRCPATQRAIPTGMEIERSRFETSPVFFGRTFCPYCRLDHEWFAREAWVAEQEDA